MKILRPCQRNCSLLPSITLTASSPYALDPGENVRLLLSTKSWTPGSAPCQGSPGTPSTLIAIPRTAGLLSGSGLEALLVKRIQASYVPGDANNPLGKSLSGWTGTINF